MICIYLTCFACASSWFLIAIIKTVVVYSSSHTKHTNRHMAKNSFTVQRRIMADKLQRIQRNKRSVRAFKNCSNNYEVDNNNYYLSLSVWQKIQSASDSQPHWPDAWHAYTVPDTTPFQLHMNKEKAEKLKIWKIIQTRSPNTTLFISNNQLHVSTI